MSAVALAPTQPATPALREGDWLVVMSKPRNEALARDNLLRQAFEVYLPTWAEWKRQTGRWAYTAKPMFPRYLMCRPTAPGQSLASIRSTYGVSGLVRFGDTVARLGDTVIQGLRAIEVQRSRPPEGQASPLAVGDRVQVVSGPLAGLSGVVSLTDRQRVEVLLLMMGRETRVSIRCDELVPQAA